MSEFVCHLFLNFFPPQSQETYQSNWPRLEKFRLAANLKNFNCIAENNYFRRILKLIITFSLSGPNIESNNIKASTSSE